MNTDNLANNTDLLQETFVSTELPTTQTNKHLTKMREMYPQHGDVDDTTFALSFKDKHYDYLEDDEFLKLANINQTSPVVNPKDFENTVADSVTTRESTFDGIDGKGNAKYITPKEQDEKIIKENKEIVTGTGEDFKSKEWNFNDEVIKPFKSATQEVAENNIMAEAVLVLGDDVNNPTKLAEFLKFKDNLDANNPMHHLEKGVANMDVVKAKPSHSVDTFLDAYKKEGIASVDTWLEFLKAIPSVTAGSVPNTAQVIGNLPKATMSYTYKLAKDSLEADGIKTEPTRTDMAKAAPVATLVMTLDKFGFSKASEPLKAEIAKAIVKNPATKIKDVMKSFTTTTVHGVKYELPTEITQEIAEVVYVKDKDVTGEDILKSSIGAVMGTAGMTTGISASKEIVSATKPNSVESILADEINKAVDGSSINQDVLKQNVVDSLNPSQAQYQMQNKKEVNTAEEIFQGFEDDIKESLEPKSELDKVDEGFKALEEELFSEEPLEKPHADDSAEIDQIVEDNKKVEEVAPTEESVASSDLEQTTNEETFTSESVARLKELEEKAEDELSVDEKFELEDLQEEVKQLQELGNDETTIGDKELLEEISSESDNIVMASMPKEDVKETTTQDLVTPLIEFAKDNNIKVRTSKNGTFFYHGDKIDKKNFEYITEDGVKKRVPKLEHKNETYFSNEEVDAEAVKETLEEMSRWIEEKTNDTFERGEFVDRYLKGLSDKELDSQIENQTDEKTLNTLKEEQQRRSEEVVVEEVKAEPLEIKEETKEKSETVQSFDDEVSSLENLIKSWEQREKQDVATKEVLQKAKDDIEYIKNSGVIEAIESPEYVMFKEKGNKRATRGVLIDLPFGFKGVVVYDKKGGGKIWEYSTSSYGDSFNNISRLPNALLYVKQKFINIGEEQLSKALKNMEIINPEIVKAKKVKTGTESYNTEVETAQTDGTVKKQQGEAWTTVDGIELVMHKNEEGKWVATEVQTGLKMPTDNILGDTSKTKLKAGVEAKIKKVGLEKLKEMIDGAVQKQRKEKLKVELEEPFNNMSESDKRELLSLTELMEEPTNKIATTKEWKDLNDTQKGVIADAHIKSKDNQKRDIIENDKGVEDGNNESKTENGTDTDVRDNDSNSDGREQSNGVQSDGQREESSTVSNEDGSRDDNSDGNTSTTRVSDERGKGDSDTPVHSGDVNESPFVQNIEDTIASGEVGRYQANMQAIKILQENKTHYTQEEKQTLSRYTGWGGLQKAFRDGKGEFKKGWEQRGRDLQNLVSYEEYNHIKKGVLDAYYTPLPLVKSMWQISQQLGFKGGVVLEPSMGTGRFIGVTPASIKNNTAFNGVEIDKTTYKIATILYGNINGRNKGFETTNYKDNHDLVIGNPPYGSFKLYDKNNKAYNSLTAHNYFVVKSLDALKEGGILNFVISSSFLDNLDAKTIQLVNSKAKMVGAIRLPSDAFSDAGTKVTTDIILFQKLKSGEQGNANIWAEKSTLNGIKINKYFVENDAMLLGKWEKGFRGAGTLNATKFFKEDFAYAITKLPTGIMETSVNTTQQEIEDNANINVNPSIMYISKDKVYVNVKDGEGTKSEPIKASVKKAKAYIDIRDSLLTLIDMQLDESLSEKVIESQRNQVNKAYDKFTKEFGALNKTANRSFIVKDKNGYLVSTLEEAYQPEIKEGNKKGLKPRAENFNKADILTKRTASPVKEINTESSSEALLLSLNHKGGVDLDYMARITSKSKKQVFEELRGEVFYDVDAGYVTADVFLSGDVKTKLANAVDEYSKKALEKVIPTDLTATDIKPEIGQRWIGVKPVQQFMQEKLGFRNFSIVQSSSTSKWFVEGWSGSFPYSADGVKDNTMIENALNNKQAKVYSAMSDGTRYINREATDLANAKIDELKEAFADWVFTDKSRRVELVKRYNELNNRFVPLNAESLLKTYTIPNIKFFKPREHQTRAVYKATFGNTPLLLNHAVGSGKTLTSQMIAMEWRRLGKAKKPLITTLKSVVPQYAKEFKDAYPSAKILVPTESDFTPENRQRLLSAIATGDYDAIIISHEQLQKIENPYELQSQIIEDEIAEMEVTLEEMKSDSASQRSRRDIENAIEKLRVKYEKLSDRKRDNVLSFDKLGVDGIIVDESHKFKKLAYSSSLGQIKGMPSTTGSNMAFDLYIKTSHILNNNNGKNVVFMTGTPITNTIPELFLTQKFLQSGALYEQGVNNFDSWAKNYVEQSTEVEITSTGGFKEVTRIKDFKNMPTLIQTTSQIIDTVTNEDIKKSDKNFKLPPLKDGKPSLIFIEPSEEQIAYNDELIERVNSLTKDSPDNHLVIFNDAGKMSIDMRLISDTYSDNENSKVNSVVSRVMEKYKEFDSVKGTQLIFSDTGTPKGGGKAKAKLEILIEQADKGIESAEKELATYSDAEIEDILKGGQFSVYEDIKKKLILEGMPENEIVFIHDYETKEKKEELGREVNAGKIRVVIGSTQKLGTGINVQQRLTAVHHIDIPYTPAELEQRNGRIIRQGNKLLNELQNFEIDISYYATKRTLDGMKWQILENKSKFIKQFFDGVSDSDLEIEEMSSSELAEVMKAEASGNPLLLDKIRNEKKLKKLRSLKRSHELGKIEIDDKLLELAGFLGSVDTEIQMLNEDIAQVKNNPIKINGKKVEKSKEIGDALVSEIQAYKKAKGIYTKTIGSVGDIEIAISYNYPIDQAIISFTGETTMSIHYLFSQASGVGLGTIFKNKLKSLDTKVDRLAKEKPQAKEDVKRLEQSKSGEFAKQSELDTLVVEQNRIVKEINDSAKEKRPESSEESEANDSNMITPKKTTKEVEANDSYVQAEGYDNAGVNYVPTYKVDGVPNRPVSGLIMIGDKEVSLPTLENPMNADTLRVYLSDVIGSRLYEGRLKGRSALGIYRRNDSSIRVQSYSDVEVMAHEMAHYLDFFHKNKTRDAKGSFFRAEILKNKEELKGVSYTTKKNLAIKEGFAEFVRGWLTNYNTMKAIAPSMTKDFEARLKKDKALHVKMERLQEAMHSYYFQGDHTTLRGKRGGELSPTAQKIQRSQKEIAMEIRQKAIDKIHAIKRIEAEIKGDVAHDPIESPYKALQMVNGHSSIMYGAMNVGVPTILENGDISYSGKSLNDIFEPATKVGEKQVRLLEDYLVAKRASELIAQGRENLISQEEIDAGLKLVETNPEFENIFNEYQEFNDAMLDFYVAMNLITNEQKANFQEFNKNYVPFHRITESVQYGKVPPSKIGQRLTGGTHALGNIMDNIINGVESNIKEALIARGKSLFYNMLEQSGQGGAYAIRVPTDSKKVSADVKEQAKKVAEIMAGLGLTVSKDGAIISGDISAEQIIDIAEIENNLLLNPEALEFWTHGHKPTSSGGYIDSVIIDDQRVYFETFDKNLVDAMTSFKSSHYGKPMQSLMAVKNLMTWNITNNPLFYLTNFTRDTISASVLSKNNFVPIASSIRGMYHFITRSKTYKDFMSSGAGYGTRRTSLGGDIQAMQMLNVNRGFDIVSRVISAFEYGADMFEYGTRVGDFALAKEQGKSNWQGAYESREVSTDFAIKGSDETFSGFMATVPFMKAGIVSIDKTMRRIFSLNGEMKISNALKFTNQLGELQMHKAKIYATGGVIASMTLALWFQNRDDERYKKLTRDQKLMYWNFFIGDKHIKVPRPYDIGFMFSAVPEIIADGIYEKEGETAVKDFMWGIKNMFSIGDVSGLFQPILEHMQNENWTGSPIIPQGLENLDDKSDQYMSSTPLMYVKAGEVTGASPIMMKHYVNGYTGLTARMIEETMENLLWNSKDWGERPFSKNPVEFLLSRFVGKTEDSRTKWNKKYYELSHKASGVANSLNKKKKRAFKDGGADAKEYVKSDENKKHLAIQKQLAKYSRMLSNIKTSVEVTYYDKKLSRAEKEKRINEAYKMRTAYFEKVVSKIKELGGE